MAESVAACKEPFVSISIDGGRESHEWMRGVPGAFDRVSAGVKTLVTAGIRPQVIMAVAQVNRSEMTSLAEYAKELGASSVKYNFVTPVARGEAITKEGGALSVTEQIELSRWVEQDLQKKIGIELFLNIPFAFRSLSSLFGPGGNSGRCGIYTILGVLHDGTYALCGIGTSVPELCFGNAQTHPLRDIWFTAEALQEIRKDLPKGLKGVCARCLVRNMCLGHCVANNYYAKQDLLAGHQLCEEALAAGVFPQTRLAPAPVG